MASLLDRSLEDKASFNITRDFYFISCKEISKVLVLLCVHSPAGP